MIGLRDEQPFASVLVSFISSSQHASSRKDPRNAEIRTASLAKDVTGGRHKEGEQIGDNNDITLNSSMMRFQEELLS